MMLSGETIHCFPHPLYTRKIKEERPNEHWIYVAIYDKNGFRSRYTHLPLYNFDGVDQMYGYWYVQLEQNLKGYWVISFKSETIIQSKCFKMTDEETQKVLAREINY